MKKALSCRPALFATMLALASVLALPAPAQAQETIKGPGGKRVVGGEPTNIEHHPWQVAFLIGRSGNSYLCGGSIIAPQWLLTAAHCLYVANDQPSSGVKSNHVAPADVRTIAGMTDLQAGSAWPTAVLVVVHDSYNPDTYENDIALVKLGSPANGRIIPLAGAPMRLLVGQPLEVTGWGRTSEDGASPSRLMKATVPFVANRTCNEAGSYDGAIMGTGMICAGRKEGGIDACQGDSGGPLVKRGPDGPVLVGVVSWGVGCARKLKYGVYTRVSAYRDWINQVVLSNGN